MTFIKKLIFENCYNIENLNAINKLAKKVLDILVKEDDRIVSATVDGEGNLYFNFSETALAEEDGEILYIKASDYFNENFNLLARQNFDFI